MNDPISAIHDIAMSDELQKWIVAIVLVLITAIVSALVTRLIRRLMRVDGSPLPSSTILVNIARIAIWVFGLSFMLSVCFNVDMNGALAALGVGGIALSLGLQDTIKNFIGGLQVTLMRIVHPGDHISVGGIEGMVQDVSWRQTVVKDFEGNVHLIPNAIISSTTVTKIEPTNLVAAILSFTNDGRDMDAMIKEMELLAKQAVEKVAPLEKDPWILITQIGEYGTWAKMRFILQDTTHVREARDAALRAVAPYTRNNSTEMLHDDGSED